MKRWTIGWALGVLLAAPAWAAVPTSWTNGMVLSLDLAIGLWSNPFGSTFLFQLPLRAGGGISFDLLFGLTYRL